MRSGTYSNVVPSVSFHATPLSKRKPTFMDGHNNSIRWLKSYSTITPPSWLNGRYFFSSKLPGFRQFNLEEYINA